MGKIRLQFVSGANTTTSEYNMGDSNVMRLINGNKTPQFTNAQAISDEILRRLIEEMKGNAKTSERMTTVVPEFD